MNFLKLQRVLSLIVLLITCFAAVLTIATTIVVSINTPFARAEEVEETTVEYTEPTTEVPTTEPPTEPETIPPTTAPPTAIDILGEKEYYILAQLLWHEAGIMGWEGKVWVCSAILNLGEHSNMSIWSMAHKGNMFSVAPYVDTGTPSAECFEVIEYVVAGGNKIEEVKYFRTGYYHNFGTPITKIENVYFSK